MQYPFVSDSPSFCFEIGLSGGTEDPRVLAAKPCFHPRSNHSQRCVARSGCDGEVGTGRDKKVIGTFGGLPETARFPGSPHPKPSHSFAKTVRLFKYHVIMLHHSPQNCIHAAFQLPCLACLSWGALGRWAGVREVPCHLTGQKVRRSSSFPPSAEPYP
jgi:hypothetical protein